MFTELLNESGRAMAEDLMDLVANQANPEAKFGRDARGRFVKGNKGGPGNPFARQQAHHHQQLMEAVTEDRLQELIDLTIEKALAGDNAMIKLLWSYLIGQPTKAPDPDRLDREEWNIRLNSVVSNKDEMEIIMKAAPLSLVLPFLQLAWPVKEREFSQAGADGVAQHLQEDQQVPNRRKRRNKGKKGKRRNKNRRASSRNGGRGKASPQVHGRRGTDANGGDGKFAPTETAGNGGAAPRVTDGNGTYSPRVTEGNGSSAPSETGHNGVSAPMVTDGNGAM